MLHEVSDSLRTGRKGSDIGSWPFSKVLTLTVASMGRGKGGRFAGFGAVAGGSFLAGFTGVGFLTESPRTKFIRNAPVAKVLYVFGLILLYLFKKCMYT